MRMIGFIPATYIIEISYNNPLFYFVFFIYLPFGQFSITPFFKLSGIYTYYSPVLVGYLANNSLVDLSNGGSFNYLLVMRRYPEVEFRNRILGFHLRGLFTIIGLIESGKISGDVKIVATSYFFNDRTVNKFRV